MDREGLKALVAELLQEMEGAPRQEHEDKEKILPDITAVDLRKAYFVKNPADGAAFQRLKAKTSARLGLGRAGTRYETFSYLRFRADHAAAQDSVFSLVPEAFYRDHDLPMVQTMCRDKDEYLTRPDLGRRFDEKNQAIIQKVCGQNPKALLVIGDGLSSDAITANALDCAAAIRQGLKTHGIELGKTLFIQFARVAHRITSARSPARSSSACWWGSAPASPPANPCRPISPTAPGLASRNPSARWSPTSTATAPMPWRLGRTSLISWRGCWSKRPPVWI